MIKLKHKNNLILEIILEDGISLSKEDLYLCYCLNFVKDTEDIFIGTGIKDEDKLHYIIDFVLDMEKSKKDNLIKIIQNIFLLELVDFFLEDITLIK